MAAVGQPIVLESLAFGGDAVGHMADGAVVFVPGGVPGDRVRLRVLQRKKNHLRAAMEQLVQPGPDRRRPPCELADHCGGCQWQQVRYPAQVTAKQALLARALPAAAATPLIAAEQELGYRRRVRLHFELQERAEPQLRMGLMQRGTRSIIDLDRCPALTPSLEQALPALRRALRVAGRGSRGTAVLLAGSHGQVHVSVVLHRPKRAGAFLGRLQRSLGQESFAGAVVRDARRQLELGQRAVQCAAAGSLLAAADSFLQVNQQQEAVLRRLVQHQVHGARVLELHAGVGTLTQVLAGPRRVVTAVELAPRAVELLERNTRESGQVEPVQASALEAMRHMVHRGVRFDTVVLDPPRQGCEAELMALLARCRPRTVVYVSCDPMTLSRDVGRLREQGYHVQRAQGLDMMPQTFHVETVVTLVHGEERAAAQGP